MKYALLVVAAGLLVGVAFFIPYQWQLIEIGSHSTPKPQTAHIVFGGDMMFDRYIRQVVDTVGGDYVFSCIDQLLLPVDLVVANLEGPITSNESVTMDPNDPAYNHYQFTFPPSTAPLLYAHNIRVVNLGNNHSLNFGQEGSLETKTALGLASVQYFSDDASVDVDVKGAPLTFITYNEFSASTDVGMIYHTIQETRESGRIPIVYAHWGDEYAPEPERTKVLAHSFVDAGAELVVGSHSHIVGENEIYMGKHINYSLGNFIFDQYFDESVKNGLLLDVEISKEGVLAVTQVPIVLQTDGRTCPR